VANNKTTIKLCDSESAIFVQIVFWKQSSKQRTDLNNKTSPTMTPKNEFAHDMSEQICLHSI
jgi:hypothetical protein